MQKARLAMKLFNIMIVAFVVAVAGAVALGFSQHKSSENISFIPTSAETQMSQAGPANTPAVAAATEIAQTEPAAGIEIPSATPETAPVQIAQAAAPAATAPAPVVTVAPGEPPIPKVVAKPLSPEDGEQPETQQLGTTPAKPIEQQPQSQASDPLKIPGPNISYVYERPTMTKLSQLYWTLGKLDLNEDPNVDFFLMINECDIYKDYFHNEFEWKTVRDATRKFISDNRNKFSLRFEVMQQLNLGEYHLETERFDIVPEAQIKNTRRFEVFANDYDVPICNYDIGGNVRPIPGYPRGLLVELTRPIMLTSLPVDKLTAHNYIEEKLKPFKALNPQYQNMDNLYALRDAYLVMKIKLFAYRGEGYSTISMQLAEVLGILEGIEIYADRKKKKLLYVEDYRRKKQGVKSDPALSIETLRSPLLSDDPPDLRQPVKLIQRGQ